MMHMYKEKAFWVVVSVMITLLQIMCFVVDKKPPIELVIMFFISIGVVTILNRIDTLMETKPNGKN